MFGTDLKRGTLLSTGAALWAAAFLIPYKQASLLADAQVVALAMLTASAVWNTVTALVQTRGALGLNKTSVWAAIALAVFSVTGNICSSNSLGTLEPAITSVLLRTQVVFVALAGALFLGERISAAIAVGAAVALAGLLVMRMPYDGNAEFTGVLWALGAANSFGAMVIITRKVIHRIEPIAVNAIRLWIAVAFLACLPGNASRTIGAGGEVWLLAAIAAFCGPFISRICIMYALKHVTAAFQVLIGLSSPAFAFALGFLILGTIPTGYELLGGAIILVGIAIPVGSGLRQRHLSAT